jgi:hypothetical protein
MMKRLAVAVGLAVLGLSCKDGPSAGELAVDLTTPNSDDGAIQFVANGSNGATISALSQACSGCKLFIVKVSDTQYKGVITGNLSAGTLFRASLSDAKHPANYSVSIIAVSNRTFGMRAALSGYSLALK